MQLFLIQKVSYKKFGLVTIKTRINTLRLIRDRTLHTGSKSVMILVIVQLLESSHPRTPFPTKTICVKLCFKWVFTGQHARRSLILILNPVTRLFFNLLCTEHQKITQTKTRRMGKVQKINGPSLFLRIMKDILISSDGFKIITSHLPIKYQLSLAHLYHVN